MGRLWLATILVRIQEMKEKPLQILSVQEKFNPGNLLHSDEANGSRVLRQGDIAPPAQPLPSSDQAQQRPWKVILVREGSTRGSGCVDNCKPPKHRSAPVSSSISHSQGRTTLHPGAILALHHSTEDETPASLPEGRLHVRITG